MTRTSRVLAVLGLLGSLAVALVLAVVLLRPVASELQAPGGIAVGTAASAAALPPLAPTPSPVPVASGESPPPPVSTPTPSSPPRGTDPLLGTDGRLTVLLLGSDYRPSHPGHRTDAIMVVSVDPATGKSAGFSVPRDTVNFPLPRQGTFAPKVNAMLMALDESTGNGYEGMKRAVARAFGIEVDRYVFTGFAGVRRLVKAVGGVDVTLDKPYYDAAYWVNRHTQGWGLPAGTSHLNGDDALIFARSRKGDNDFGRARRQQMLVMAALAKARGLGPSRIPQMLAIAADTVRTDLPLDRANDLFQLFSTVDLGHVDRVVFGPRTYASGSAAGSFALRLDVCREWIRKHFPPARPLATWPQTVASGG
jgi:polyisoprenyl-teichoic acid--peptidoglycan teichoic acid transferase